MLSTQAINHLTFNNWQYTSLFHRSSVIPILIVPISSLSGLTMLLAHHSLIISTSFLLVLLRGYSLDQSIEFFLWKFGNINFISILVLISILAINILSLFGPQFIIFLFLFLLFLFSFSLLSHCFFDFLFKSLTHFRIIHLLHKIEDWTYMLILHELLDQSIEFFLWKIGKINHFGPQFIIRLLFFLFSFSLLSNCFFSFFFKFLKHFRIIHCKCFLS